MLGSRSRLAGILLGAVLLCCALWLLQSTVWAALSATLNLPWSQNERVNDTAGETKQQTPDVAADDAGHPYAIWRDDRGGNYDIYFSYRLAAGNWSADVRVNDDTGVAVQDLPSLVTDGVGNSHAVWKDFRNSNFDIYAAHRPAGGSWGENERVDDGAQAQVDRPDLAIDSSGHLYALWQDWRNGDPDVYFSFRPAGGSWGPNERVGDAPAGTIQVPGSIAVDDGGNAYAVWADRRNGHADIYFSYRPAGGTWSAGERVNDDAGAAEQWDPAIAADSAGNAYVVWQDNRSGNYDIYSSYRPAGGSWGTNVVVNDDAAGANQATPALALQGDRLVAVWQDWRSGNADIYSSPGLGAGSWATNERVNDDAWAARQLDPAVAVDSAGVAYAVWSDERDGDADVYFGYRVSRYGVFVPFVLRGW